MTPMILGNNEDKVVNYCIRVIHQEDNKVKVVVVDKNNNDKVVGVIADDIPTGRYVDCDLTARLYVDYTDALPIQAREHKEYRTVELIDIKGNNMMNSTVLVVKGKEDKDSTWIGLSMPRRMLIGQIVKVMNDVVPNFSAANCAPSSSGAFTFYGDTDSQLLYIEDTTCNITYKISFNDVKHVVSPKVNLI